MRVRLSLVLLVTLLPFGLAAQSPPPSKGESIVVRGCLDGPVLDALETRRAEGEGEWTHRISYRLTGPKERLKSLRGEHNGRVVEVRGILKSNLSLDGRSGARVGNTRVHIGVGGPGSPMDRGRPSLPVLEVTSFTSDGLPCR